jgi:hypothetical protein
MIIDSHVHIFSFPSFRDLSNHIRTMEDAIAFRTRYPELYKRNATDEPIDNTDELIRDMDKNGIDFAIVQTRQNAIPTAWRHWRGLDTTSNRAAISMIRVRCAMRRRPNWTVVSAR